MATNRALNTSYKTRVHPQKLRARPLADGLVTGLRRRRAAELLQKLLALGLSRYEPYPRPGCCD
jgi:hypothetical protein